MKSMQKAFSWLEVLLVLAIVVILAIVILPNFFGSSRAKDLTNTTLQIVGTVREAQSQSASQAQNTQWGIHFEHPSTPSQAPFYAIFRGTSYASGTVAGVYRLPPTLDYSSSTLPDGSYVDVVFSPISGIAIPSTTINLFVISNPSMSSTISISSVGEITVSPALPIEAPGS